MGFIIAAGAALAQPPSPLEEGRQLYFAGDFAGAAALWRPLADAGDPRAMYNMATLYRRGLGVAEDREEATRLLRAAAEKGFAQAQYLLASELFDAPDADEARRQEAVGYWLAAAHQGHGPSQYRLALLYWNGEAVARDLVRGYAWMSLAAAQDLSDADTALATMARYLSDAQKTAAEHLKARLLTGKAERAVAGTAPEAAGPPALPPQEANPETAVDAAIRMGPAPEPQAPAKAAARTPPPVLEFAAGWRLQLAAFRAESAAEGLWTKLRADAPDLLAELGHRVVVADLGPKGVFYRLQIGPFATRADAVNRCRALKAAGQNCIVVAPGQ